MSGPLPKHLEFELSRLLEKEIHYHLKVEVEKKQLERLQDFNTVAMFTILDTLRYGYLDFESFRKYFNKYKKGDVKRTEINSLIRRLNDNNDGKISFSEFS